ncbi:Smr/MutS family protein [Rhodovulum marinum]|uniref:Smr/MutS family protein n=1 Tax=Rhodovulum marinum TaxID=320662 RepID=UPI0031331E1F
MQLEPFRVGARAPDPSAHVADGASTSMPVRMDRKAFARLKGGKLAPEARIDLHGMTLAQAHPALTGFILRNHAAGRRLVLVITGKGRGPDGDGPIPERRGVLKRQVPHWLHQAPLAAAVLQVTEAHRRHGGDGAFYVYLRRPRSG